MELFLVGYSTQPGLGHSTNYGKKPVLGRVCLPSAGFLLSASGSGVTLQARSGFVYVVLSDRKIDRKAHRQQTTLIDKNGM